MKLLLSFGLFLAFTLQFSNSAWSLVWVNTVTETNPPSTDCISTSLSVTGDLSATHTFFQSSASISGSTISVYVEYTSGIGLPVITPFTQIVDLGTLAAGAYTVITYGVLDGNTQSSLTTTLNVTACCGTNADFTYPASICLGDEIVLTNSSTGAISQEWFENGSSASTAINHAFIPGTAGSVVIKLVTSDGSCQDSVEYTVNVIDLPTVTVLTPNQASYCEGEAIEITNNAINTTTYNWSENGTFISPFSTLQTTAINAGPHTFKLIASNGSCTDSMEVTITVASSPTIDSFTASDTTMCLGDTISFTSTSTNATLFKWYENGVSMGNFSDFSTSPSPEGTYTYTLVVGLGNCFDSTHHIVEVLALPVVDLGPDTNDCLGPIVLDAGAGLSSYLWQDQSSNQTLTPTTTGTYSVMVSDVNGCTASDEILFESCSGLNEILGISVSIYPNPVSSTAQMTIENFKGNVNIRLTDFKGKELVNQTVFTTGSIEVNMKDLSSGVYYIHLNASTASQVFKVVKK